MLRYLIRTVPHKTMALLRVRPRARERASLAITYYSELTVTLRAIKAAGATKVQL